MKGLTTAVDLALLLKHWNGTAAILLDAGTSSCDLCKRVSQSWRKDSTQRRSAPSSIHDCLWLTPISVKLLKRFNWNTRKARCVSTSVISPSWQTPPKGRY